MSQKNRLIEQDIKSLIDLFDDKIKTLGNKTIFVTGATGLLGSYFVKTLMAFNKTKNSNIKIIAQVRNIDKAKEIFASFVTDANFFLYESDLLDKITLNENVDYIVHLACPTASSYFVSNPVETIDAILFGTKNVLEFANDKNVKGFVYSSSLEVYGVADKERIKEADYGYIEQLNTRSSYSMGKRMAECLCFSYYKEYNVPVKIARLTQTFGPGVNYDDKRVFAEFARCVIEKKNIVLHTDGSTVRSYLYIKDAVSALLYLLLFGENGEAYNVANPNIAISIKDMAQLVCDLFPDANIKVEIDIPDNIESFGYNPTMIAVLDADKICKLGWKATTDLDEMFINLIESMRNNN